MCNPSITHFDHNVPEDPPIIAVCPCPHCGACVGWAEPTIACHACGTEWELTPAQADDFTLAILGVSGLNLALFVAAIAREEGGSPSSPLALLGRAFACTAAAYRPIELVGVAA